MKPISVKKYSPFLFLGLFLFPVLFLPSPNTLRSGILPSWKFAIIGDTQTRNPVLKWAAKSFQANGIRFGVHLGDLHWCYSSADWAWKRKVLKSSVQYWFWIYGNHEKYVCRIDQRYLTWGQSRLIWSKFWYGRGDTLRVRDVHGWRFIALDTAGPQTPANHAARLEAALRSAPGKVFLFAHRPLPVPYKFFRTKVTIANGRKIPYGRMGPPEYKGNNLKLWKVIYKWRGKIAAVFHGHHHAFVDYQIGPLKAYSTGGGGGTLETRGDFYHWLLITVMGTSKFRVKVIRKP